MLEYPEDELIDIIKEVGFECDLCARCCTKEFNDHVYLLEKDAEVIKNIDPSAIEPAPYYEFCDQNGRFYVSGYALKTDADGSCIFLKDKRCQIYEERLTICRLYPYMLHREADEYGNIEWRQISGLNEHGCYHNDIGDEECTQIARQIKEYEAAYLEQVIGFLEKLDEHFKKNNLKHVQSIYDKQMRRFSKGEEIEVLVYHKNGFERHLISKNM